MKRILAGAVLLIALLWGFERWNHLDPTESPGQPSLPSVAPTGSDAEPRAGSQFESEGTVVRVLPDDDEGSRHQRFIVRLASGRTVLIAHNIDLAPRVEGLVAGDTVAFSGEFADNDKGGVVHWTHHDPNGQHASGWIKHRGRTYR
jgi:hypothetical protein